MYIYIYIYVCVCAYNYMYIFIEYLFTTVSKLTSVWEDGQQTSAMSLHTRLPRQLGVDSVSKPYRTGMNWGDFHIFHMVTACDCLIAHLRSCLGCIGCTSKKSRLTTARSLQVMDTLAADLEKKLGRFGLEQYPKSMVVNGSRISYMFKHP